ncbi:MAG: DNA recombination protein RmuC [Candidatus Zipacnadales bacterium]
MTHELQISMVMVVVVAVGIGIGVAIGMRIGRLTSEKHRAAAEARLEESMRQLTEQKTMLAELGGQLSEARSELARLEEANRQLEEQRKLLEEAKVHLGDAFRALSAEALSKSTEQFLTLAKETLGSIVAEAKGDIGKRQEAINGLIRPLQEALKRYEEQIAGLEQKREQAYGSLTQQLTAVASTQQQLQSETRNLVTALRRPEVRGRWGEITLQRVVEISGMTEHCDFELQTSISTEEGLLRPDLVVRLPNDRTIVVDAKAPLDAYMEAIEANDEVQRNAALARHARQVRERIQQLSSKAYWGQFSRTPDFVVLFLPGESFFSAALEQDRELIETGIRSQVLLATPTTLIALLRSVALSWHQEKIIEHAEEIAKVTREFCDRVAVFAGHLMKIRTGLENAAKAYNAAVGSWESRVLPWSRRVAELGGATPGKEIAGLEPVEVALRQLPSGEDEASEALTSSKMDRANDEVEEETPE